MKNARCSTIIFIAVSLFCIHSFGQVYTNHYSISNYWLQNEQSLYLHDGNILMAGSKSLTTSDHDLLLVKINTNTGDTMWTKTYSYPGIILQNFSATELTDSDIIISSDYIDTATPTVTNYLFVLSVNSSGSENWAKVYNYPAPYTTFRPPLVRSIPNNEFWVVCTTFGTMGAVLIKMDHYGDTLISKSVLIDSTDVNGGFLFNDLMQLNNELYFTGSVEYAIDESHMFLLKTDTNGNIAWLKSDYYSRLFGADIGTNISANKMIVTRDSQLVIGLAQNGIGLLKTDTNGNISWYNSLNDTFSSFTPPVLGDLTLTSDGGFLLTGYTDYSYATGGTFNNTGKPFIARVDQAGNFLWGRKYAFDINNNFSNLIRQLPNGNMACSGTATDTLSSSATGNSKYFVLLTDSMGNSSGAVCGLDSIFSCFNISAPFTFYNRSYAQGGGYDLANVSINGHADSLYTDSTTANLSVILLASPNSEICALTPVFFTANYQNAGPSPYFNFLVNGISVQAGSSNVYSTSTLGYPETVQCVLSGTGNCLPADTAFSNTIIPLIYPSGTPVVTITANPAGVIAPGTTVTFTVTYTNGGPSPTFLWYVNGSPVTSFQTYITDTLSNLDLVTCEVTNNTLCSAHPTGYSNDIVIFTTTGINSIYPQPEFTISPDPADQYVYINSAVNKSATIIIRDIPGRIIYEQKGINTPAMINTSDWMNGIYFITITSENDTITDKLIISH